MTTTQIPDRVRTDPRRLAGLALLAGCVLGAAGFVALGLLIPPGGYTDPLWVPLYGVVLAGDLLVVLGLPAVLVAQPGRLTLVGYVGVFAPLVMLNVAETALEAFVKPYLATHGGIPADEPAGLDAFETVALVLFLVGVVCLAVAVLRARVLPRWVAVALVASLVAALTLHDWPYALLSDVLVFAALGAFGVRALRT